MITQRFSAPQAVFIEHDKRAFALISANIAACGAENRCVIIRDRAEHALQGRLEHGPFDIVVLDPPYDFEPFASVLELALRHLAPGGLLILEHAFRRTVPVVAGGRVTRTVRSGDSALTMIEARETR
jgi:16S rRNA (guanine966-N2)-methyltransferase